MDSTNVKNYGALETGELQPLVAPHKGSPMQAVFHPDSPCYRYLILILACLIPFSSCFASDMPGAVKPYLSSNEKGGLGLSDTQYNMLFSIYAWPNTVLVFFGGYLIDKLGVRRSIALFLLPCFIGQSLVCLSIPLRYSAHPEYGYYGMLFGRFLFGLGGECVVVAQNAFITQWFHGKELAFAFAMTFALSRTGMVLSYNLVPSLAEGFNIQIALWSGSLIIVFAFLCYVLLMVLDLHAEKVTGKVLQPPATETQKFSDFVEFPMSFWLLCILITTFYASCFPFVQNFGGWLHLYYGYPPAKASSIAGAPFALSLVLMPLFGAAKDAFGYAAYALIFGSVVMFLAHCTLAFTSITFFLPLLGVGVAYSTIASVVWSSIPPLVGIHCVGSALGFGYAAANIGQAVAAIIVGHLATPRPDDFDREPFFRSMQFFVVDATITVVCAFAIALVNFLTKGTLNQRPYANAVKEKIDP